MHFRTVKAFLFLFCVYFIFISQQQDASLIYFNKRQVLTWSVTYFFLILDLSTVCIKKIRRKKQRIKSLQCSILNFWMPMIVCRFFHMLSEL